MNKNRWCALMRKASSCSGRPVQPSPGSRAGVPVRTTNTSGTGNIFVAVEVTTRRTKVDVVAFVKNLLETVHAAAVTVHLVLDNLNTFFPEDLGGCVGETAAVAEVEIGIMDRQCTGQRIAAAELSQRKIARWQVQGNAAGRGIEWKFTGQDADRKLSRHNVL